MVTARSSGPRLRRARQRAANTSSVVESGPPETASTRPGAETRSANNAAVSTAVTGRAAGAVSAAHTLLFRGDAGLHVRRSARIFAPDLRPGSAGHFLFAQRRQRLTEPQQRIRRFGVGFVFR